MPIAAPKPCTACGVLVRDGSARCEAHKVRPGQFADSRRGSRHARGYGSEWDRTVLRIRRRDHDLCQPCLDRDDGHIGRYAAVDHKVPRDRGGSEDDANLQVICRECHAAKTAREASEARWGGRISTAALAGTDIATTFSRAQVSGVGGYAGRGGRHHG